MRQRAPFVFDWLSRVWNARETVIDPECVKNVPEDAAPFLKEIAETHLVQLAHNAVAYGQNHFHFEMTVQGCHYQNLPVSRYRVYCLEQLRQHFSALNDAEQQTVKTLLPISEARILWENNPPAASGYDTEGLAPFNKAINVYGDGVPT